MVGRARVIMPAVAGLMAMTLVRFSQSPAPQAATDYFVISGMYHAQQQAQDSAASHGGWVLDTDLYPSLRPKHFAEVRGPYRTLQDAQREAHDVRKFTSQTGAYATAAGSPIKALTDLAGSLPPAVYAALLGEIQVIVADRPGGANPCEPQEPYQEITLSYASLERTWNKKTETVGFAPHRQVLDMGGFWRIQRTGAIERMRICAE